LRARVFSLKAQEALRRAIAKSLRTFYPDIEIDHRVYDEEHDSRNVGQSYLQLLKASTIGAGAFTLEVENQYGTWDYWDYSADIERANHFLRLSHDSKEKIFPAVAILNRMVIVPQGIRDALDVPTDFAYIFKPLDLQGVLSVDFDGRDAIPNAIARVGAEIRAEIVSLARRQMAMHRIPAPDLEDLSKLLGAHVDFLEELRQEILSPLPRLVVEITSGPARLRKVSRVVLEVRNESEHAAGLVDVQIRAPWNGMEEPPTRYSERLDFSPGNDHHHSIEIDVVPRTTPYCPLEVLFLFEETMDSVTFPLPLILDVQDR
jgi:hypothetical protein